LIPVPSLPGGSRVTDQGTLEALRLLAAAPPRLLTRISQVTASSSHGLVAQLRSGPSVYFGDASDIDAKWAAATEVLADSSSVGATYVDVTDPARPVAGVSPEAVTAAGLAPSPSQGAAQSSTTPSQTPAQGTPGIAAGG
jgi:hypothetical protein